MNIRKWLFTIHNELLDNLQDENNEKNLRKG